MLATAARMAVKPLIPAKKLPRQDDAPRARARLHHPHIARLFPGDHVHLHRLAARVRNNRGGERRESVSAVQHRISDSRARRNARLHADSGGVERILKGDAM